MLRQFSAGAIVLRHAQDKLLKNKIEVLLIKNKSIKDKKISFWGFPKGHIEKGESSKDAALRELMEETGIEAEVIKKVGDSRYIFTQNKEKIFKLVIVYLMKYISGDAKPQLIEIDEVRWIDPKAALEVLTFRNDQDLLKKSLTLLSKEGTKTFPKQISGTSKIP